MPYTETGLFEPYARALRHLRRVCAPLRAGTPADTVHHSATHDACSEAQLRDDLHIEPDGMRGWQGADDNDDYTS